MIQPEAYYAAHKEAPDPLTLGRIGFAMVGREDELVPPLTSSEKWMLSTILRCNKWHNENRDAIKDKWRKDKQRQRSKDTQVSTDVHQCPQDNDGQPMSTTSLSLTPSLSPSLTHSSSQTNTTRSVIVPKPDGDATGLLKKEGVKFVKALQAEGQGNEIFNPDWDPVVVIAGLTGDYESHRRWRQCVGLIGEANVREECFTFYREIRVGEVPDNRGAALNSRFKKIIDGLKEGK